MKKLFSGVKGIILIIAIVVLAGFLGYRVSNFKHSGKTLKLGFEDKDKLVTQTCHIREIEDSKDSASFGKIKIPFTESRLIMSYDFDVNYAVDFSSASIVKIDNESKTVEIDLPKAEMYDAVIDNESQHVFLDQGNIFSRIDSSEINEIQKSMRERAINDCNDSNVIELANNNAKKLIEAFVKGNDNYRNYAVKFNLK